MSNEYMYEVKANDNAWNVAKNNLRQKGNESISNEDIINEMNRLAKINNCKDYNEFNSKFFSKAGNEFKLEEQKQTEKNVNFKFYEQPKTEKTNLYDKLRTSWAKMFSPADYAAEAEAKKNNKLKDDKTKIIEYNRNHADGNYLIVDKKVCKALVYNKDGEIITEFPVGLGKKVGDDRHSNYMLPKNDPRREEGRYTTAGEFTLEQYEKPLKNYGTRVMALLGDNRGEKAAQPAIHMIPENHPKRIEQLENDEDGIIEDNRMSFGCVNLLKEDYDVLKMHIGAGDKVYILPEEDDNKLILEKQDDNSYKFVQQKFRS